MATFNIRWLCPKKNVWKEVEKDFTDTPTISAKEWAEDYAYGRADKGPYEVRLVT